MRRSIRADGLFLGQMAWMDTAPAAIGIALLWNVGIPGGGGSICGGNLIRGGVVVVVDAAGIHRHIVHSYNIHSHQCSLSLSLSLSIPSCRKS